MAETLFLAHRIPYPPDKGDKIRSWHILERLARRGTVHLGAFVDDPADMAHAARLAELCGEVKLLKLPRGLRWRRSLKGYLGGEALSMAQYRDREMIAWVRDLVRKRPIDAIVAFSAQMAPYALPHLPKVRTSIMDFVDVDSEKWLQYAQTATGWRRSIYKREGELLRAFEKYAARHFKASLFVSEPEAALFRKLAGSWATNIRAMSNGVDYARFDPAVVTPVEPPSRPAVVFSGAMDYRANVQAALWFATEVWPCVRAAHPAATFQIVGGNPNAAIRKLDGKAGVTVTGRVPDMPPWIAAADAVVAPLQVARGIQNKVLEAMAMARPVVATPGAAEGIDAEVGTHLLVAKGAEAFAAHVNELLADPARGAALGAAARARIVERYSWNACLAPLDELLGPA